MMTFIVADRTVQSKGTFKGCYIYSFKKDGSRYKTATWHEAYGLSLIHISEPTRH